MFLGKYRLGFQALSVAISQAMLPRSTRHLSQSGGHCCGQRRCIPDQSEINAGTEKLSVPSVLWDHHYLKTAPVCLIGQLAFSIRFSGNIETNGKQAFEFFYIIRVGHPVHSQLFLGLVPNINLLQAIRHVKTNCLSSHSASSWSWLQYLFLNSSILIILGKPPEYKVPEKLSITSIKVGRTMNQHSSSIGCAFCVCSYHNTLTFFHPRSYMAVFPAEFVLLS